MEGSLEEDEFHYNHSLFQMRFFFSPVLLYTNSFVVKCKISLLKVSNEK